MEYEEGEGTNDWYLLGPLFIYHITQDKKLVETLDYDSLVRYEQVAGPELLARAYQFHLDNIMSFRLFDKKEFLHRLKEFD